MKYKNSLPNGARPMGNALEYFRPIAKETDNPLVRVVANERESICEAARNLFTP